MTYLAQPEPWRLAVGWAVVAVTAGPLAFINIKLRIERWRRK